MSHETKDDIRQKRFQNEAYQEENLYARKMLEDDTNECFYLYQQKSKWDEELLEAFHRDPDFPFFIDFAEETRRENQNIQYIAEEGEELLRKEKQRLEDEAEALYEQELKLIKEEDEKDGQNGHFRGSSPNGGY